jgi:hypothetical protein
MDMDFRSSFQKALLDNNELIARANELMDENNKSMVDYKVEMAGWREVIGKDENSGIRKFVCQHEKDIRGEGNKPGLWTVVNRVVVTVGLVTTIGGSALLILFSDHPNLLASFLDKF